LGGGVDAATLVVTAGATANITEGNSRASRESRSFSSVVLAVAPAVTINEASSLSWYLWSEVQFWLAGGFRVRVNPARHAIHRKVPHIE